MGGDHGASPAGTSIELSRPVGAVATELHAVVAIRRKTGVHEALGIRQSERVGPDGARLAQVPDAGLCAVPVEEHKHEMREPLVGASSGRDRKVGRVWRLP